MFVQPIVRSNTIQWADDDTSEFTESYWFPHYPYTVEDHGKYYTDWRRICLYVNKKKYSRFQGLHNRPATAKYNILCQYNLYSWFTFSVNTSNLYHSTPHITHGSNYWISSNPWAKFRIKTKSMELLSEQHILGWKQTGYDKTYFRVLIVNQTYVYS